VREKREGWTYRLAACIHCDRKRPTCFAEWRLDLGGAVVTMMQATQSCASNDMAIRHGAQAATWSFFAEPEVSSVVMVVANVVGEKSLQVKLIESDDVIK